MTDLLRRLFERLLTDFDVKAALPVACVFLGWLLGQGAIVIRDWRSRRRLKKGLETELEDLRSELRRVTMIRQRQLQVLTLGGIEAAYPTPINNFFYKHHFKDVFAHLNREQRLSYQHIHSAVDMVNAGSEEQMQYLKAFRDSHGDKPASSAEVASWGERVQVEYMNTRTAVWYVENHLAHRRKPTLDEFGPIHESFLKFQDGLAAEIQDVMAKSKSLTREQLEKLWDERAFRTLAETRKNKSK